MGGIGDLGVVVAGARVHIIARSTVGPETVLITVMVIDVEEALVETDMQGMIVKEEGDMTVMEGGVGMGVLRLEAPLEREVKSDELGLSSGTGSERRSTDGFSSPNVVSYLSISRAEVMIRGYSCSYSLKPRV